MNTKELNLLANDIRALALRAMASFPGAGHIGGSMSISDLLAVLYGNVMKVDPKNPGDDNRDMMVLSKGHAGPALYAALAIKGFFPEEMMMTLNSHGTSLPSHCDRTKTPGIDMTTGSLGQGLSAAMGMALSKRVRNLPGYVYCICGDGEIQEGQIWEAAMASAQFSVDNLILFIDDNKQQVDGYTKDIMNVEDIQAKFTSFNWHTQRIDGHNVDAIITAIEAAKAAKGRPSAIIMDTEKGKGCSYAMNRPDNHDFHISQELLDQGLSELSEYRRLIEEDRI